MHLYKKKKIYYSILRYAASAAFLYFSVRLILPYGSRWQEHQLLSSFLDMNHQNAAPDEKRIRWTSLQDNNSDIIAWIMIPDTNIDYPIVQGADNKFYLQHDFLKNEYYARSYFSRCTSRPCIHQS